MDVTWAAEEREREGWRTAGVEGDGADGGDGLEDGEGKQHGEAEQER
jgi:hypothetical protein